MENERSGGSTLAKILMVIGLATVVATAVTILCKKLAAKKAAQAEVDESAIDDYEECDFDCEECDDSEECEACECCDAADEEAAE